MEFAARLAAEEFPYIRVVAVHGSCGLWNICLWSFTYLRRHDGRAPKHSYVLLCLIHLAWHRYYFQMKSEQGIILYFGRCIDFSKLLLLFLSLRSKLS